MSFNTCCLLWAFCASMEYIKPGRYCKAKYFDCWYVHIWYNVRQVERYALLAKDAMKLYKGSSTTELVRSETRQPSLRFGYLRYVTGASHRSSKVCCRAPTVILVNFPVSERKSRSFTSSTGCENSKKTEIARNKNISCHIFTSEHKVPSRSAQDRQPAT